ncbi:hypothetical protein EC968_007542 [Mortierella alpina]|nr:hypothetical protein EC968_007542 [Mortierella alpina]
MPGLDLSFVSSLPQEIFEMITSNLSTKDLAHCVRVNHAWSDLFLPQLWKTIEIRNRVEYNTFNTHDTLKALLRNCHFIQTLHTCNIKWIWALVSMTTRCRNLKSLTLVRDPNALSVSSELVTFPPRELDASFARQAICVSSALPILLKQNRRLQHVKIEGFIFHPTIGCRTLDYILKSLPTQSLDRLEIKCKSFLTPKSPSDDIDSAVFQDGEEGDAQEDDRPFALRELTLSGRFERTDALFAFLERCPRLESLILRSVSDVSLDQLSTVLQRHCPLLSRLTWEVENCNESDADIANLLDSSSSDPSDTDGGGGGGWKSLQLPFMKNFGPLSAQVLQRHASTLTQVSAYGWGSFTSPDIQALLCSTPRLQNLNGDLGTHATSDGRVAEMVLHAQDPMHSRTSWAGTSSLRHLRLVINGIHRPDVKCDHTGRPFLRPLPVIPNPTSCLQLQETVCRQLGAMTQLRKLVLGRPDIHGVVVLDEQLVRLHPTLGVLVREFQYQCLELSLDSGLSLMSELKEMRILDVTRMAHRIGVAELEWMHVNWPKLETIEGLFSQRLWEGHGDSDWDGSEAVQDWMEAHPLGVGSSFYN